MSSKPTRPSRTEKPAGAPGVRQQSLITAEPEMDWSLDLGAPDSLDTPRAPASHEVGFCDEGVINPTKGVPILAGLRDPDSPVGEELRLLAAKVHDLGRERGATCIAVSSSLPGEGKSTISLGLASALAQEPGRRVLLIEADLRRPTLTRVLGVPDAQGLGDWLNSQVDYVPVRLVQPAGFFLLVAGHAGLKRPELMGSARMDALLQAARRLFHYVILDALPILPVADTILMQDLVDGFLLVARARYTPRDAIHEALARLRRDRVMGIVLNDHVERQGSYRSQAYKRYGMG